MPDLAFKVSTANLRTPVRPRSRGRPAVSIRPAGRASGPAQLGHGSKDVTKKHYIEKPALAPDSSDILEQLAANQATFDLSTMNTRPTRAA